MKKIWTDFNEPNRTMFRMSEDEIKFFNLKLNERFIFYTEDIEVEAIVRFDEKENKWYGKIDSDYFDVPHEIVEAREDGFLNGRLFGIYTGRNEIIKNMLKQNLPKELIAQVTNVDEKYLEMFKY